ncbi:hypothetical protein LXL04_010877 [Taraxacum kok-saghyz]
MKLDSSVRRRSRSKESDRAFDPNSISQVWHLKILGDFGINVGWELWEVFQISTMFLSEKYKTFMLAIYIGCALPPPLLKKTRKLRPLFLWLCASAVSRLRPCCRLLRLIGFSSTATPPVRLIVLPPLVKRFQNLSGDHDMTFPYVEIKQWIVALNLAIDSPWKPFYVNNQVGG